MDDPLDLITSESQLASVNDDMANYRFEEVAPSPLQFNDDFWSSEVRFRYRNNGSTRSLENQSYIRMRLTVTDEADEDDGRVGIDDLATLSGPSMNPCAGLFQKCEFLAGGTTITSVSDNVAQVSTLEKRILLSQAQLKGTHQDLEEMEPLLEERLKRYQFTNSPDEKLLSAQRMYQVTGIDPDTNTAAIAGGTLTIAGAGVDLTKYFVVGDYIKYVDVAFSVSLIKTARITALTANTLSLDAAAITDGPIADGDGWGAYNFRKFYRPKGDVKSFELCWRPPLGIFSFDKATPSGEYEIVLQPYNKETAKIRFFESLGFSGLSPLRLAELNVNVDSAYLYVAKINAPMVKDSTVMLDLIQTRCQRKAIEIASNEVQEDFTVSPTTSALTLAFQSLNSGSDTRYPVSKYKLEDDHELQLERYQIHYADMVRPHRLPAMSFEEGGKDFLVQQYNNTITNTREYFNSGGAESYEDWKNRGAYYHMMYPRSGEDRATRVNTYTTFASNLAKNNGRGNLLLFSHIRRVATLSIRDSQIERVSVDEV